jgi:fructokinase
MGAILVIKIGIYFGATKIEAAAMDKHGKFITNIRAETPNNYDSALNTIRYLVKKIEDRLACTVPVGLCMPGSICAISQKVKNSNLQYLNDKKFNIDISEVLKRHVKIANDANCFTLSEAYDGAGKNKKVVCGIILGTGCGGGIVINSQLITGANGIAAEWGHNPLPWATYDEYNTPKCYCGLEGCLEQWISGTGLMRCYEKRTKNRKTGKEIYALAKMGESSAIFEIDALTDRIGRAIASICNVIDPDVVILGGGLSNISSLYDKLPEIIQKYILSDVWQGQVLPPLWGDSSGLRGAARLWD